MKTKKGKKKENDAKVQRKLNAKMNMHTETGKKEKNGCPRRNFTDYSIFEINSRENLFSYVF